MIEIREYDVRRADDETLRAMAFRCEQEGHDWQNCASIFLRIYQACRWCGQERPFMAQLDDKPTEASSASLKKHDIDTSLNNANKLGKA